jgi:hypothetical protein
MFFRIFNIFSLFNLGFFRILMSHQSAVTFDTVCFIIFVSCVFSFPLSPLFLMFSLLLSVSNIYGKYGRKVIWNVKWFGKYRRNTNQIVKRYGHYGRNPSWIVERNGKYGRKVSWILKWFRKYGRKVGTVCFIIFVSCVFSFPLSPLFLMFSLLLSVSNIYFTSQYHQRILFHNSLSNLYNNVIIYKF